MTTQNDDQDIPVDGAPGGRFYVQSASVEQDTSDPKVFCTFCSNEASTTEVKNRCHFCSTIICAFCLSVGYETIHNERCRKGVLDPDNLYVCTCGFKPLKIKCKVCFEAKIKRYNCFNCETPKQATMVCTLCMNHYMCSLECEKTDAANIQSNHGLKCKNNRLIHCQHGKCVFFEPECGCRMCNHGKWSGDCDLCITHNHYASHIEVLN
jgi:hypothetical protein